MRESFLHTIWLLGWSMLIFCGQQMRRSASLPFLRISSWVIEVDEHRLQGWNRFKSRIDLEYLHDLAESIPKTSDFHSKTPNCNFIHYDWRMGTHGSRAEGRGQLTGEGLFPSVTFMWFPGIPGHQALKASTWSHRTMLQRRKASVLWFSVLGVKQFFKVNKAISFNVGYIQNAISWAHMSMSLLMTVPRTWSSREVERHP